MLRKIAVGFAGLLLVGGLVALALGAFPVAIFPLVAGALILLGTLYERIHYKPIVGDPPGSGWIKSEQRFVDEKTGRTVTVYVEPKTGERAYVSD